MVENDLKAKPGDRIMPLPNAGFGDKELIVIKPDEEQRDYRNEFDHIWVKHYKDSCPSTAFYLRHDEYKIVCSATDTDIERAKVGDIITIPEFTDGKEYLVTDDNKPNVSPDNRKTDASEIVWFRDDYGIEWFVRHKDYRIIRRASSVVADKVCRDCKGTGKIELFTSIAICNCRK
jgi:hypothetical protein